MYGVPEFIRTSATGSSIDRIAEPGSRDKESFWRSLMNFLDIGLFLGVASGLVAWPQILPTDLAGCVIVRTPPSGRFISPFIHRASTTIAVMTR